MVENPPANAGDTGSSPGLGRSHMPRSSWAHEPQLLSLCVWSLCSATREAVIVRGPRTAMKSVPRLPQLEKALARRKPSHGNEDPTQPKIIKKKKKSILSQDVYIAKIHNGPPIFYFSYPNISRLKAPFQVLVPPC